MKTEHTAAPLQVEHVKFVTGYTALAREIHNLGIEAFCDCLEIDTPADYPKTPYAYTGGKSIFWKSANGNYYAYPEIKHRKYQIIKLNKVNQ